MKSLSESLFDSKTQMTESLFDKDIVKDVVTTVYDLINGHVIKFKIVWGEGLGWTHFFDRDAMVRAWKKEGRPELTGSYARTTFPPDLKKFISLILKNVVITKKQLEFLPKDGYLDCDVLNKTLDDYGILADAYHDHGYPRAGEKTNVRVQISYIEGTPAGPGHGVMFRNVGIKRYKGFHTEDVEVTVEFYDTKSGYNRHTMTLLTDLAIKDIKQS